MIVTLLAPPETVTVFESVLLQPLAFVTVTLYVVAEAGETVIVCVCAAFDQLYEAKPAPASRVMLSPAQIDDGPLAVIVAAGAGFTVTETVDAADVHEPTVAVTA
ncbi:MAG: hypothetical protein M3P29_00250 [Acidobacteriota bacterium]|nr:hypothetical protein [Acidobacteriota bacterium]